MSLLIFEWHWVGVQNEVTRTSFWFFQVENSAGVRGYIPKNYVCFPAFESGTDHVPTPETWDSGVSGESRAVSANTDVDSNAGWDIPQENIRHTGVVDEYFPDEDMRGDTEPGKHPEMYIPQEWGHETEIEIVATDAYGVATSTFEERTADDPQTITTGTPFESEINPDRSRKGS